MRQLVPCPGCARHVRLEEPACPFCGDTSARAAPARRAALRRSRAAVLGAALATTAAAGCYKTHIRRDADAGTSDSDAAPFLIETDAGVAAPDAYNPDAGGPALAYGGPPTFEADAGGPGAEYGGPPMFEEDAGFDPGHGDPGADYGGPPSE